MFTVIWTPDAKRELEAIWKRTGDMDAILLAIWSIERTLGDDPVAASESRTDDDRVAFVKPLGVLFELDVPERTVEIFSVWNFT